MVNGLKELSMHWANRITGRLPGESPMTISLFINFMVAAIPTPQR